MLLAIFVALSVGYGSDGKAVFLRDIWPSREEIEVSLLLSYDYWLRHPSTFTVQYQITYKLCLFMHLIHIHKAPPYLADIVTPIASVSSRGGLWFASNSRYEQPWMRLKFGQCCFSYAAPAAWNTPPPSLQQLTNTDSFKRQLKTVLFERAFSQFTSQFLHFIWFIELWFLFYCVLL